jgi:tetratricopeptide (TPR) repeat protein
MKKLTTLSWLTCTFLFGSYFAKGQFAQPDSLFSAREYRSAAVGYEWVIHNEKLTGVRRNLYLAKKAECYFLLSDYEKTLSTLERADFFEEEDPQLLEKLYAQYMIAAYLSGNPNAAYRKLLQAKTIYGSAVPYEIAKLEPFILIDLEMYDEINPALERLLEENVDSAELKSMLAVVDVEKLKEPRKAILFSYITPGVGMFYTGNYGKGILSAGIQGIAGAYGLYGVLTGYFFTAAIPGVGLFYTFYVGGARYAGQLAEKRNEVLKNKWKASIASHLLVSGSTNPHQ